MLTTTHQSARNVQHELRCPRTPRSSSIDEQNEPIEIAKMRRKDEIHAGETTHTNLSRTLIWNHNKMVSFPWRRDSVCLVVRLFVRSCSVVVIRVVRSDGLPFSPSRVLQNFSREFCCCARACFRVLVRVSICLRSPFAPIERKKDTGLTKTLDGSALGFLTVTRRSLVSSDSLSTVVLRVCCECCLHILYTWSGVVRFLVGIPQAIAGMIHGA